MIDFDAWRARYDQMSWSEQVAFYDGVWRSYPDQKHYDAEAADRFFDEITETKGSLNVLELGGWRGELAKEMLGQYSPSAIHRWTNVEICRGAVSNAVAHDPRYGAFVPPQPPWAVDMHFYDAYDVFVASHVIEHMRGLELAKLLPRLRTIRFAFIASPLSDGQFNDWSGYNGSHILEWGWQAVIGLFETFGFHHRPENDRREVRVFWRS